MKYQNVSANSVIRAGDQYADHDREIWVQCTGLSEYVGMQAEETGLVWRRPLDSSPPVAAAVDRGERYRRTIRQSLGDGAGLAIEVDIADVCHAFSLPYMLAQAVKKVCLPGDRGAKDRLKDLREAAWHIQRQIQIEEAQGNECG